jgi:hypothetical protein
MRDVNEIATDLVDFCDPQQGELEDYVAAMLMVSAVLMTVGTNRKVIDGAAAKRIAQAASIAMRDAVEAEMGRN